MRRITVSDNYMCVSISKVQKDKRVYFFALDRFCPQLKYTEEKDILFITYYHQGGAHTFDCHHRQLTNILRMSNPIHKRIINY